MGIRKLDEAPSMYEMEGASSVLWCTDRRSLGCPAFLRNGSRSSAPASGYPGPASPPGRSCSAHLVGCPTGCSSRWTLRSFAPPASLVAQLGGRSLGPSVSLHHLRPVGASALLRQVLPLPAGPDLEALVPGGLTGVRRVSASPPLRPAD